MYAVLAIGSIIAVLAVFSGAVPSQVCFAKFRWEDCGKPPVPVMYYWKSGSRCEVGIWRGCLPNLNMFKNEYECVSTCIFTVRAEPEDFHKLNEIEEIRDFYTESATDEIDNTISNSVTTNEYPTETPNDDLVTDDATNEKDIVNDADNNDSSNDTTTKVPVTGNDSTTKAPDDAVVPTPAGNQADNPVDTLNDDPPEPTPDNPSTTITI